MFKLRLIYIFRTTVLGFVTVLLLPTISSAFQNEPEDFRRMKWGTYIANVPHVHFLESIDGTNYYINEHDKMKIGDASLRSIKYGFYKQRFFIVFITFYDSINFSKLKQTLFGVYGKGNRPNQFREKYIWRGSDIVISLNYDKISKKGSIVYTFIPILTIKVAHEIEEDLKGAGDL